MPLQLPFVVESVWPSVAVPESVGGAVLAGATPATTPVAPDVAESLPQPEAQEFADVTTTRIVLSTSAETSV